jgi:hypothetical protein
MRNKVKFTRPGVDQPIATLIFRLSSMDSKPPANTPLNHRKTPPTGQYNIMSSTGTDGETSGMAQLEPDSDTSMDISISRYRRPYRGQARRMMLDPSEDPFISTGRGRRRGSEDSTSSHSSHLVYNCQSCQCRTSTPSSVPINLHHHHDSFYSPYALEPTQLGTLLPELHMGSSVGVKEMVSVRPTTAAIPAESVILCMVCAGLFRWHRLHCNECFYVPRSDELHMRDCSNCFDGIVCLH